MEKKELAKYEGKEIWVKAARMGGMYTTIYRLNRYRITKNGTLRYKYCGLSCVANNGQYKALQKITGGRYFDGRPTAKILDKTTLEYLIID